MTEPPIYDLPFQPMLSEEPIQVVRLNSFYEESSFAPHRHSFYMCYCTTKGTGEHRIDFRNYPMQPGSVFFLHKNQVHQMMAYPEDGWMILFNQKIFHDFLIQNPHMEQWGLFDYFSRSPMVQLTAELLHTFSAVISLLYREVYDIRGTMPVIQHYLAILLLYAGAQSPQVNQGKQDSVETAVMRKLKILIGQKYKSKRETSYYSEKLGVSSRRLNEITMETMGKLVSELVADRLLSEGEALLGTTGKSVKEISYHLGFADQAHFAYFFKKAKGQTPSQFREEFLRF